MIDIEDTLRARGERYGNFDDFALIAQSLKKVAKNTENWHNLRAYQRESIEMILHKVARILNGDPDYSDNWHDISGYATLVEQIIKSGE